MTRFRFLIAALALCSAPLPAQVLSPEERLQFADGLLARGMQDQAVEEYKALIAQAPDMAKADVVHYRLGEAYRQLGNLVAADKEYRLVFTRYTNSQYRVRGGFRRAGLFMQAKQYGAAADLYGMVLQGDPPPDIASASLYYLSDALSKEGKKGEAQKALERIREQHPTSPFYSAALLKLAELLGKPADASVEASAAGIRQAIALYAEVAAKPSSDRVAAEALFQMAELHFARKEFKKSAEAYAKLLATYPLDERAAEARLQSAWAAHNAGLYADALRQTTDALARGTGAQEPQWLYIQANCERQLLRNADAVRTYARLLKEFSSSEFAGAARYEKALTSYRMGDFKDAVAEATQLKLVPQTRKDVYWLLAESHAALKQDDEAIQYYRLLTRDFPDSDVSCDAWYRLAHLLQTRGVYQEASQYYNSLVSHFPQSDLAPKALFASAYCLTQEKMHAEAVRDWTRLVSQYPTHALIEESLYQRAIAETTLKRDPDALASFAELLKRFPDSKFAADAYYWIGRLLSEGGKWQDAERNLRLAMDRKPRPELERDARYRLGIALQRNGKTPEAAEMFQPLLASPVKELFSPELLQWLSEYRFEKGQIAESLAAAQALADRGPAPAWRQIGWSLAGRCQVMLKDMAAAEKALSLALAEKASTRYGAEAALRLAEVKLAAGKFEEASRFFRQAAEMSPDDSMLGVRARAHAGLGHAAKGLADHAAASRYFMSVAILYDDPEIVPQCLAEAAEAFRKVGKQAEADKAIKELRDRYPNSPWVKRASAGGTKQE